MYIPTSSRLVYFRVRGARVHAHPSAAGRLLSGASCPYICLLAAGRFTSSGARHTCTCPPAAGLSTLGREASVYMPQALAPKQLVKDIHFIPVPHNCIIDIHTIPESHNSFIDTHTIPTHAQRQQAGLLSGAKRPFICPSAAGGFTFGREAPVYMPIGGRPFTFGLQTRLLSGAEYIWLPAASRFTFGRGVYMATSSRPVYFRLRGTRVHAHRPQAFLLWGTKRLCTCRSR